MSLRSAIAGLVAGLFLVVPSVGGGPASAAEPYEAFVEGLRDRRYYDIALQVLDQAEKDPQTPAEYREVLDYERAMTHVEAGQAARNAEDQLDHFDRSQVLLEKFFKEHADHPRAADAGSQLGKILLQKARVLVWKARSPSGQAEKGPLRESARKEVAKAQENFQVAHDRYKTAWDAFPKFIDPKDQEQVARRGDAEVRYIRAQLDLAQCLYETAQTYDRTDPEFEQLLKEAAKAYDLIHQRYRSMVSGLYARVWEGKCWEEQNDLTKALGIYNELLGHTGTSESLMRLKDQARQFRLICLNNPVRHDYVLVIDEATEWLKERKSRERTEIGLGIRWEMAQAHERLAEKHEQAGEEKERRNHLQFALTDATFVSRFPGPFQYAALDLARRAETVLKGDSKEPQDFDSAYTLATSRLRSLGELQGKVRAAVKPEEQESARKALADHIAETIRFYRLALSFAGPGVSEKNVTDARYNMSYLYYESRRYYESAAVAEYLARTQAETDPEMSQKSALIALGAFYGAFQAAPPENREWLMGRVEGAADRIATLHPKSPRANEARMMLGRIQRQRKRPADAADWFAKVPEGTPQYVEAQLEAGQAYLAAYGEGSAADEASPPAGDVVDARRRQLDGWRKKAEEHLARGIELRTKELPESEPGPPELAAAKVSLAQLRIGDGKYQEALDLLQGEPHSVLKAIAVPEGTERPQGPGVTGQAFAGLVHQLRLRAFVGLGKIDDALAAMGDLEQVGGAASTGIYVQLGRELQKELAELKANGQVDRLAEVRTSFESFLTRISERTEGQTYGSLIWIAETWFGLGEGGGDSDPASAKFFDKAAAAYQTILDRRKEDPSFFGEASLPGVQLRLVNCRRRQKDFTGAYELALQVVSENPTSLQAQVETARVLQSWGESAGPDTEQRLVEAMNGAKPTVGGKTADVWGWAQLSRRLADTIARGKGTEDMTETMLDARFQSLLCRQRYAIAQRSPSQRNNELDKARAELNNFALTSGADVDETWWNRFDALYRQVQKDAGATDPKPLRRISSPASMPDLNPPPGSEPPKGTGTTDAPADGTSPADVSAPASGGSGTTFVVLGVVAVLGLVLVGFLVFAFRPKSRKGRRARGAEGDESGPGAATRSGRGRTAAPVLNFELPGGGDAETPAAPVRPKRSAAATDTTKATSAAREAPAAKGTPRPAAKPVAKPVAPVKPVKSDADDAAEPVAKPAAAAKPVAPVKPVVAAKPAPASPSAAPAKPAAPVKPAAPAKAVAPVKPAVTKKPPAPPQ